MTDFERAKLEFENLPRLCAAELAPQSQYTINRLRRLIRRYLTVFRDEEHQRRLYLDDRLSSGMLLSYARSAYDWHGEAKRMRFLAEDYDAHLRRAGRRIAV